MERHEADETARTRMSSKTSTKQQLIRQRSPLGLAAACGVTGVVLLVSMAWQWAEHPEPLFAAWVIFILALVWSLFVRPAVLLDEDGVTIRNVVRDIHIPWVRVTDVECRWSLKVLVGDRAYTAWAISSQVGRPKVSPGRLLGMTPGRLDAFASAGARPPTSAPKVTASSVARAIEDAKEDYSDAVARGAIVAPADAQVRITLVPMALAIVFLPAIAVVALTLT